MKAQVSHPMGRCTHLTHNLIARLIKTVLVIFPIFYMIPDTQFAKALDTSDQCGKECNSCSINIGDIDCYDCEEGYKLIDFKCHKCTLEGCGSCNEYLNLCGFCTEGYYNNSKSGQAGYTYVTSCAKCISGCKDCLDSKTCENCYSNYNQNEDLTCTLKNINLIRAATVLGCLVLLVVLAYLCNQLHILALCIPSLKKKRMQQKVQKTN